MFNIALFFYFIINLTKFTIFLFNLVFIKNIYIRKRNKFTKLYFSFHGKKFTSYIGKAHSNVCAHNCVMASKVLIYISQLFYSSALIILIKIQSVKYNLTFTACRFYVLKVRHSLEFPFFLFINSLCLSILYNFFYVITVFFI